MHSLFRSGKTRRTSGRRRSKWIEAGWRSVALCLALASLTPIAAFADDAFKLEGPPKIAVIFNGLLRDGGWNQVFDDARLRLEKSMNTKIAFVENVKEEAGQFLPPVGKLIDRGYNIIIATCFCYSDAVKQASLKYPKVAFLNGSGTTNGPNLVSFYPRTYEGHYLCGMAAGAVTKTGKLGFVSPFPFGVINWTINAYLLGARKMNPNATVTAVVTGGWDDPAKERAVASALIDQGADVIDQHTVSPAPQLVAQERGVYGVGSQLDMMPSAPKATLCSTVYTWDRYLEPQIKKISSGDWHPSAWGDFVSIKDGGLDITCCNAVVPKEAVAKVDEARSQIMAGKLQVFAGPISDAAGTVRVPEGKVIGDADLWKMDWFIPGVTMQK
jgi:basic membrane protein A and related proteins